MIIKKRFIFPMFFLLAFSFYVISGNRGNELNKFINNESFSYVFRSSLKEQSELGPNFNKHDYVFSYSCGGGAICGNIFDSKDNVLVDFPSEFLVDSKEGEFNLNYDIDLNEICFTGKSAFDSMFYDNKCYKLVSGKLLSIN